MPFPSLPAPTVPGAKMHALSNASQWLKALGAEASAWACRRPRPRTKRPRHGKRSAAGHGPGSPRLPQPRCNRHGQPDSAAAVVPTQGPAHPHRDRRSISGIAESGWLSAGVRSGLERGWQDLRPWPVAIGDPEDPTPNGHLSVKNKVVNPQYASKPDRQGQPHGWTENDHSAHPLDRFKTQRSQPVRQPLHALAHLV